MFDYPKLYNISVIDRAISWLAMDEGVGISSFTIFRVMMGDHIHTLDRDEPNYGLHNGYPPADFYDFGRCYRLLKIIPEWKDRLNEIPEYYPRWKYLVSNWNKLESLYESLIYNDESYSYEFNKRLSEILNGN